MIDEPITHNNSARSEDVDASLQKVDKSFVPLYVLRLISVQLRSVSERAIVMSSIAIERGKRQQRALRK